MKRVKLLLITVGLLFGAAQNAWATSLHSLNTYGASLGTSAAVFRGGFGPNAGIVLPDAQVGTFAWSFTVPLDHVVGNPIVVGLTWHSSTSPCTASLRPNFISVARLGSTHIQGGGASTGLAAADGVDTLVANATNSSELKFFLITSPDGVNQLQPLDVVTFGLFRSGASAVDTCTGNINIQGAWLFVI